jgi:hypothetical protein
MTGYEQCSLLLAIVSAIISAVAIIKSATTARTIHREQTLLSQRQLFLEIWPKLSTLSDIDPAAPVAVDVINAVNVLELVGLCWEGEMVDANVIRRTFGMPFVTMYDKVHSMITLPAPINKTGAQLLNENPAIGKLYATLKKEIQDANALAPIRSR